MNTSSGKTQTMTGMCERAVNSIFESNSSLEVSMLEIYIGQLFDLLHENKQWKDSHNDRYVREGRKFNVRE